MGIPLIFWIIHYFSHCFKGSSHGGNLGEEGECIVSFCVMIFGFYFEAKYIILNLFDFFLYVFILPF